ncbi:hypothetical protein [Treponema socranskii]|uniref:hypothetical protein n=1 Tax=Treponema socranskii TaxID=53419 RepID=UPI0028E2CC68|nr:hypothetical protein [Treponema socranskii]
MDYDLFSRLFKYKENASNSPLENYLTEQFAYILEYLVEQKSEIIGDLFKLFDIPVKNKNLLKIHIKTQWGTWVKRYNHFARPDIKIIVDKSVYFIEAKVESDLNQYEDFDQIQLYEAIDVSPLKNKGVRILTKYQICTKDKIYLFFTKKHKIFWRQIYELISKSEFKDNILIKNFLHFLEENDMAEKNALHYSADGLSNFYSLYGFLNDVLQDFARKEGYTENDVKFNGDKDYFGFDIAYGGTRVLWIGCFNTETNKSEKDFIVVTSYADEQELLNQLKSKQFDRADNDGYLIYAKLYVHDILQKETFEEQKEIFDNWLKENYVADILSKSWDIISQ